VLRVPATDNACDSKLSESPASRAGAPGFFLFDAKLSIAASHPAARAEAGKRRPWIDRAHR